jgi:hypothetical protein
MRKKTLKRRIENLQNQNDHIRSVLFTLVSAVKPPKVHYAMYATVGHFTAEMVATLEQFWKWADLQDRSTLTKEDLLREFELRMPMRLKGRLDEILEEHRKDGTPQFAFYADLVLGKEDPPQTPAGTPSP